MSACLKTHSLAGIVFVKVSEYFSIIAIFDVAERQVILLKKLFSCHCLWTQLFVGSYICSLAPHLCSPFAASVHSGSGFLPDS